MPSAGNAYEELVRIYPEKEDHMKITILLLTVVLGVMTMAPTFAADATTRNIPPGSATTTPAPMPRTGRMMPSPAMMNQIISTMQDMMIMSQNTATWTPQGLVVLQGNRLLVYAPDLTLQHTVVLPAPAATATATAEAGNTPGATTTIPAMAAMPAMRSMIPPKIIPTDTGLLIVRWQQIIRLDNNYEVACQSTLPDLPPLTPTDLATVCPACIRMAMMQMGMMAMAGMPRGASAVAGTMESQPNMTMPAQ